MNTTTALPRYTLGEEIANSITSGLGIVLAIAGLAVLTAFAALHGDAWHIVGASVFGAAMIVAYTTSTLYHSIQIARVKRVLRALDHSAIFLLIAGTYTPFMLVNLRGPWGWSLFGVVWGLALLGGLQELRRNKGARILSVVIYVVMGWVALVALVPLLRVLGSGGFAWLAAGGLFYTVGIVFYALDARLTHAHGIWHLFVLAGSACHYVAILRYVL